LAKDQTGTNTFVAPERQVLPRGLDRDPQPTKGQVQMGILDKITGRAKQAAGDLTDDASLRRQGKREERKGEKKDELDHAQSKADEKAEEVADLERKT